MGKDRMVEQLVQHFDEWPAMTDVENRPGGTGRMTNDLYPYDMMFSPIDINRLTVKNRLVMAPMGNISMCDETGRPNDMMLEYFFARAKGGTGLLTTGLIPVSHGIDATVTELDKLTYFPRIDRSRTVLAGWRDLAQGVHSYGSRIFIQLTAGLGRVGNPQCLLTQFKFPQSASVNPNYYIPNIPSLRMSDRKLKKIVKNMGQGAADAKHCGLDGVYLHGHEGYLLEQITNPAFNRRKLGRYRDWMRFGVEIVEEIRERVGPHYPIMYRIDLTLALEETYSKEVMDKTFLKKFRGGRTLDMTLEYMHELVKAGVDIFDVDMGCYDNWWMPHPPASMPAGCFLELSKLTKDYFKSKNIKSNAGKEVPVVAVGKLGYPDIAEQALRDGKCDMIMLGRPLLADPEWPNKAYAGKVADIRPCISCQEACINEFVEGGHPQCAVNPRTSFESVFPAKPPRVDNPKKIAVIGAGPGGVLTACLAAERGHKVDLYEKEAAIGGRIIPGSQPKIKFDVENYLGYMERRLADAEAHTDLEFFPNTEVTAEQLKDKGYDKIVVAVGTRMSAPPIQGLDTIETAQAVDLFIKPELLKGKKDIVVIGGGAVGCEMAQWLAYEHNMNVTVVEMLQYFMDGVCTANRGHLLHALKAKDVKLLNLATVTSVEGNTVRIKVNQHKNKPYPYNSWSPVLPDNVVNPMAPKIGEDFVEQSVTADMIVLATGGKADTGLYHEALAANAASEIYCIGDSFNPGLIHNATKAGYRLGMRI